MLSLTEFYTQPPKSILPYDSLKIMYTNRMDLFLRWEWGNAITTKDQLFLVTQWSHFFKILPIFEDTFLYNTASVHKPELPCVLPDSGDPLSMQAR